MGELMEDHIINHMPKNSKSAEEAAEDMIQIVRAYLKRRTLARQTICETDAECVAEIPSAGAAIRLRPWIASPTQRDPGIARIG